MTKVFNVTSLKYGKYDVRNEKTKKAREKGLEKRLMRWGRKNCKEQVPVESYGGSPIPHKGQRELSQVS